jgi:hypothetical protein
LNRRRVRVALGAFWVLDAALQAQPVIFTADWWRTDLAQSVMGQPAALNRSILWAIGIVAAHAAVWNTVFVLVQAAIGLSLIVGRGDRVAIALSVPWALGIWWVGEGLGMLPSGFALAATGSPGPVLLYPLIGLLAWPSARDRAPGGGPVARRAALASWVVLWAGQAVLQLPLLFPVRQVLTANVQELSQGLPGWQVAMGSWVGDMATAHPVLLSAGLAVVQLAVGLAVIGDRTRRGGLVAGIAVSVVFALCFQYIGGVFAGGATDPGSAPLMVLLASALWPAAGMRRERDQRAPRLSLDRRIDLAPLQVP